MPQNNGFEVGPGVDAAMKANGDKARGSEVFYNDAYSLTPGDKYLYIAHKLFNHDTLQHDGWNVYEVPNADKVTP